MSGLGVIAAILLGGSAPPAVDVGAEYRRGMEALQAQRFRDAEEAFGHVLEAAPNDANTHYLMGLAATGLGDLKGARKHYERAVKADKNLVGAIRELGITYAKLGMRKEAEGELGTLRAMQAQCAGACSRASELNRAADALAAAIAAMP